MSERWQATYPKAAVGVLIMDGVSNPERHSALDERKQKLEEELRVRYAGFERAALRTIPTIAAYDAYYKRFKKSYHVRLQLESVAIRGQSIPRVAALVEAMFMAELQDLMLTAGHDLDAVEPPVVIEVAEGTESYIGLDGQLRQLKAGDMLIADARGVISSVIYGPDLRTQITSATHRVLFTTYAPPGISVQAVRDHLLAIQANVLLFAPQARVTALELYHGGKLQHGC